MAWRTWWHQLTRKASRTQQAVWLWGLREAAWTPRDYATLAREGYEVNATVYACVNAYAQALAGLSWLLFQRPRSAQGRRTELTSHPLLTLLARPNPWEGRAQFFARATGYLLLSGNTYLERVGPGPNGLGTPRELHVLRPDRVQVVPDPRERVRAYRWRADGPEVELPADAVLHLRLFHPTDDWYGLSPLLAAARAVDTDNAAQQHNFQLLKNGMRPSGALVVQGRLSDADFTRLRREFLQEHTGVEQAGLPLILQGGLDWRPLGLTPQEADFLETRKLSKLDIAQAYHVPPELIGLKEATFENRKEARKAFYTESVLPLAAYVRDELNAWLVPLFGERLELDFDRDAIEALQEDREKVWARLTAATWLTLNEKRLATGYDERPEGDVVLVPLTLTPLGAGAADESLGPSFEELEEPETRGARRAKAREDGRRTRRWLAAWRPVHALERSYLQELEQWLTAQRDGVLARLERLSRKSADLLLFDVDAETGRLQAITEPMYRRALRLGQHAVQLETGLEAAESPEAEPALVPGLESPSLLTRLRLLVEQVRSIPRRLHAQLRELLEAGLAAGRTVPELAQDIREFYGRLSAGRARTIARTEVGRAYNEGRQEGFAQLRVSVVEWLSARDERVRVSPFNHAIDGEQRPVGHAFSNGLRYPHDPAGEPGNVINCRCVLIPVE